MGSIHQGIPRELLALLQHISGAQIFLETGTNQGGTAVFAARSFANVWSIEAQPEYHAQARSKFADVKNVQFVLGRSEVELPRIVNQFDGVAICWLDAHWSGGMTAGEDAECPILDEIRAIDKSPIEHVILIDDARLFLQPPPRPHKIEHWPTIAEVLDVARTRWPQCYLMVVSDVIVRVPARMRDQVCVGIRNQAAVSEPLSDERGRTILGRLLKKIGSS